MSCGNSNWRGPVWFPVNVMLLRALIIAAYVAQAEDESSVTNKAVDDHKITHHEGSSINHPPRRWGTTDHKLRGAGPAGPHTYEITFAGEADSTLRAEFDDCEVIVGRGITTLRVELPDQGALGGMLQRIIRLGLQVTHLHLLAPPSASSDEYAQKWPVRGMA